MFMRMGEKAIAHVSLGGPTRFIVDGRGKEWRFEDHPHIGPIVLTPRDDPATLQPGEGSQFWPAWKAWRDQGKRINVVSEKRTECVWEKAK